MIIIFIISIVIIVNAEQALPLWAPLDLGIYPHRGNRHSTRSQL